MFILDWTYFGRTKTGSPLHRENRENGEKIFPHRENTRNLKLLGKHREVESLEIFSWNPESMRKNILWDVDGLFLKFQVLIILLRKYTGGKHNFTGKMKGILLSVTSGNHSKFNYRFLVVQIAWYFGIYWLTIAGESIARIIGKWSFEKKKIILEKSADVNPWAHLIGLQILQRLIL